MLSVSRLERLWCRSKIPQIKFYTACVFFVLIGSETASGLGCFPQNINIHNSNTSLADMKTRLQQGFTLIELLVVITIIAILASLAVPTFGKIQERGYITKGISNCRQIITAMRIYSGDNGGNYMDNSKDEDGENPTD